jgi:uncharacterized protein YggE
MFRSPSIIVIPIAMGIAGVLALAGCSGGTAAAPDSASSAVATFESSAVAPFESSGVAALAASDVAPLAAAPNIAPVPASSVAADTDRNLITVQGVGKVSGTPDVVTIALGVETRSASAQSALDDNNKLAADTIAVLKDSGVAPEDLQTSQLSVYPSYDDKGKVTGYQVTNMVTAKLRDIGKAGAVIDAAGKSAGDAIRVQQLSFAIDDDSAPRAAARAEAVKRAQAQAKQLADAAGVALGPIHSITETAAQNPIVYPAMAAADSAAGAASVPIEAGSLELSVTVQVAYEIAQ